MIDGALADTDAAISKSRNMVTTWLVFGEPIGESKKMFLAFL